MSFWKLLRESAVEWKRDDAGQLAASTAYYTILSIAPLLIIVITMVSLLLQEADVEAYLLREVKALVGQQGMGAVASMLSAAERNPHTPVASLIGFGVLVFGASGLMAALQDAFNRIWKIETDPGTNAVLLLFVKRVFSVGMVLTIGFLLLVSLVVSALVSIVVAYASSFIPTAAILLPILNLLLSFLAITALFCVFYKFLPDIVIPWKTVLPGAALTALFFTLGKMTIGTLLTEWDFSTAYGVTGSVIVLLLWINYSAQAMFLGAEFTKVYARDTNALVVPRSYARFRVADETATARRRMLWKATTCMATLLPKTKFTAIMWNKVRKTKGHFMR